MNGGRITFAFVYDVVLRTPNGDHRSAVVRVGGWFFGSLEERVDAKWQ